MVVLGLLCIVQFASSITLVAINKEQQAEILNKSWVSATNHRFAYKTTILASLYS